ncbi:MAG: zinc ABC transporter substrate-binding protein [Candidatus Methanomethyliaceae archaeon]|nr:zinc ABC transporter substrate-binding protein [Candidatus Methanomethyliaceae archaeon]MDW7970979.1 zinc ABC transporter substrate-binding protein [Nitrososphaerota archaeon]
MKGRIIALIILASIMASIIALIFTSPNPYLINEGKIRVVVTFYPLAYLTEKIGGERITVTTLIPYNVDPHHWQPSPSDILEVQKADVVVINGAGMDDWLKYEIMKLVNVRDKLIIDTTKDLPLIEHNGETDPHTWISPYMAMRQAEKIFLALMEKDPKGKSYYQERFNELKTKLEDLDLKYQKELLNKKREVIIVSHEAFGYLAVRYGFKQIGVIGISAEEEPSAIVIKEIIDLIIKHNITIIYTDPTYPKAYIETIKKEVPNVEIEELYLMLGPIDGKDYLEQLEENLKALKKGLG